ncbi:MAG: Na+/H+ antiporter subunit E [Planctomycetes bacterium]|jgi:multicomponent Na+:H+ antiporter subunit E|nr:Na+/H+ antiporter subunit E [Planctomycetota bacterium]
MNAFLANMLLAIAWAALLGRIDLGNLAFGFLLGYLTLAWVGSVPGSRAYVSRLPRAAGLLLFFLWELVLSTLRVALDVVTPHPMRRPGVVAIPLDARTDLEITLLSSLITLTPGSLSLDVSEDRRYLYVHAMFLDDPEEFRRGIKEGFERRVLELLR